MLLASGKLHFTLTEEIAVSYILATRLKNVKSIEMAKKLRNKNHSNNFNLVIITD